MIAALVVVSLTAVLGSPGPGSAKEVLQLENDFAVGLVKRDAATFRKLLAEGFIYTENDQMMDRETMIEGLTGGTDTVTGARNEEMQVHPFGETVLVTGWLVVEGHGAKGAFRRRYRFTDTWRKRAGRWQLIGAHDFLAP